MGENNGYDVGLQGYNGCNCNFHTLLNTRFNSIFMQFARKDAKEYYYFGTVQMKIDAI